MTLLPTDYAISTTPGFANALTTFAVFVILCWFVRIVLKILKLGELRHRIASGRFVVVPGLSDHVKAVASLHKTHLEQLLRAVSNAAESVETETWNLPCALRTITLRRESRKIEIVFHLDETRRFSSLVVAADKPFVPPTTRVLFDVEDLHTSELAMRLTPDDASPSRSASFERIGVDSYVLRAAVPSGATSECMIQLRSTTLTASWILSLNTETPHVLRSYLGTRERVVETHELFGLETGDGNDDEDCVVCLSERKNACLLPCRHACVCFGCVTQIGDACPVCRTRFESFLVLEEKK